MKKNLLGFFLFSILAFLGAGCSSSSSTESTTWVRLPAQTGTHIPRLVREKSTASRTKRPDATKPTREKTKPKKPAKSETDEDFVPRGGFR